MSTVYGAEHLLRMLGVFLCQGHAGETSSSLLRNSEHACDGCDFDNGSRERGTRSRLCQRTHGVRFSSVKR